MNTTIGIITPQIAESMLDGNTNNRKLNLSRVKYYASLMIQGKWKLTHQGIAIAKDGTIVDGQHRLKAVIMSGEDVIFNVSTDVQKETQKYIDVGYKRTVANVFQMHGIVDAAQQAAGIGKYFKLLKDKVGSDAFSSNSRMINQSLTNDDYLKFYNENEENLIWVLRFSRRMYDHYNFYSSSQIYGFALYCHLYMEHPKEMIQSFFEEMYMLKPYSGRTGLLKSLFKILVKDATGTSELKNSVKAAMLIKTYNAYMKRKDGKQIKFTESKESFPSIVKKEEIKL